MSRYLMFCLVLAFVAMAMLQGCGSEADHPEPGKNTTVTRTTAKTTTTTTRSTTTTATKAKGPSGLYWCEDINTFYKLDYHGGIETAAGQCLLSQSPGAYYTSPGEKADDGKSDREWMCFSPDFDLPLWTDEAAQKTGYTGACLFKGHGNQNSDPEDVDLCSKYLSHHPSVCQPGPSKYWGACWSSHSENWKCIPRNHSIIQDFADGDCKANVVLEPSPSVAPTKYFFDGVCRFEEQTNQIYKCDTVPFYLQTSSRTCGRAVDTQADEACFSVKSGVYWQCMRAKPCIESDMYYSPVDMVGQNRTTEESASKCQERCTLVPGCVHFSFWPDGGCHLQNSTSKPKPGKGVTAGPPSCPRPQCDWTALPGESTQFYTGFCVFPESPQYKHATDAHNLTTTSLIV